MKRIKMDAVDRKNEILDVANGLFESKGYDNTSITDILNELDIARGTLYYHFNSKEEIMDKIIERQSEKIIETAKSIASNKNISVTSRLVSALNAINFGENDSEKLKVMHKPQNALMHQKINNLILENISPILSDIVKDGINEGIFQTKFPLEAMEMIICYANVVFDFLNEENFNTKMDAFIYNISLLLGVKDVTEVKEIINATINSSHV